MADRPPNQAARVVAVGGLILACVLVIFVIATTHGSSDSSSGNGSGVSTTSGADTSDPRIEKSLQNGIYVVQEGDTLTSISGATGIDVDTLITLNPSVDPQILVAGTHLKLK